MDSQSLAGTWQLFNSGKINNVTIYHRAALKFFFYRRVTILMFSPIKGASNFSFQFLKWLKNQGPDQKDPPYAPDKIKAIDSFLAWHHLEAGSAGHQLPLCLLIQKPGPPAVLQALAAAQAHPSQFTSPAAPTCSSGPYYGQDQIRWSPATGLLAPEKCVSKVPKLN